MRIVFAVIILITFSGSIVQAQKVDFAKSPKVGDFVLYCTDNFKDCVHMVILVDIELMAEQMAPTCKNPRNNDAWTKSIVDWLARHKETHNMQTRTGIRGAMKAVSC